MSIFLKFCEQIGLILYLIYDFNALEKAIARGDNSWGTAVDIAVNLYLDIINLFLDLLEILAASD